MRAYGVAPCVAHAVPRFESPWDGTGRDGTVECRSQTTVSAGLPIVARVLIGLEYNIGPKLLAEAKKHTLTLQQAMVCRAVP